MGKGTTGVRLAFYAVMAFVLAMLGQTLLGGLLIGFAVMVEKDEWLIKQTIAAFVLSVFTSFVSTILNAVNIFSDIPLIGWGVGKLINCVEGIITLIIVVACLLAISRVKDGRDADVIIGTRLASWATENLRQTGYQYQNRQTYTHVQADKFCPGCGAKLGEKDRFCTKCGYRSNE